MQHANIAKPMNLLATYKNWMQGTIELKTYMKTLPPCSFFNYENVISAYSLYTVYCLAIYFFDAT